MTLEQGVELPLAALDALLPMHVVVNPEGLVKHAGPTFRKICPSEPFGRALVDVFEIERPLKLVGAGEVGSLVGTRLRLRVKGLPETTLKGVVTELAPGAGHVLDLSFGISVVSAVAEHGLTGADFAQSDQTIEMLYLAEANLAAMSEARRLIERLEVSRDAATVASLCDGLTKIGNRRALEHALAAKVKSGRGFALLQIDLDFFKSVNDTHGHAAGDAVLKATAERLAQLSRRDDDLARIGGDEFVMLVGGTTDEGALRRLAERLIAAIEEPVLVNGAQCRVSASIGVSVSTCHNAPDLKGMLAAADAALYAAKRSGRGRAAVAAA